MYNEFITDGTDETTESTWFLGLKKRDVMRHMLCDKQVTTIPSDPNVTTPSVPLGRMNSNKAQLETARRLSLAMHNVGKPPLAPTPMASNVPRWVTFGPTMAATTMPATVTVTAPMAVTGPTTTYVMSHASEFDKGDAVPQVTTESCKIVSSGPCGIVL